MLSHREENKRIKRGRNRKNERERVERNQIINSLAIERLAFRAANSQWQPTRIYRPINQAPIRILRFTVNVKAHWSDLISKIASTLTILCVTGMGLANIYK